MTDRELSSGYPIEARQGIDVSLERLVRHLAVNKYAVAGGLVIRYYAKANGLEYAHPFNDLDLITLDNDAVKPSVTQDFLIYHYHPGNTGDPVPYYVVLVDPETRIKVDIFIADLKPTSFESAQFQGKEILLASAEDQLVKTLFDLSHVSSSFKLDPKTLHSLSILWQIADLEKADKSWKMIGPRAANLPQSIREAKVAAEKTIAQHPNWLKEKPFRKSSPYICQYCQPDRNFPITPMDKIYKILGYTE